MIAGAAADIPVIQNPGIQVNQSAEGHLKLMAFYLRHQTRAVNIVRKFCELRVCVNRRAARPQRETYQQPINAKDWLKMMETVKEYLCSYLGKCKIP